MKILPGYRRICAAFFAHAIALHAFANVDRGSAERDVEVSFATYIGGVNDEAGGSVAVAPNGDRVFCASAQSTGLATEGALQPALAGEYDIIVGRYSADGSALLFLTYFGGERRDVCNKVAVDSAGDIVVVGYTASADFPTVNAADSTHSGGGFRDQDGFVTKISGDGETVVFSTFLGGLDQSQQTGGFPGDELVRGLTIDSSDRIIVAGDTAAPDFPATQVIGVSGCGDDPQPINVGRTADQFVARYLPDGTVDFATCISGSEVEFARDVAVNDEGLIYLGGSTISPDYPTTRPKIGPGTVDGIFDGVITVLNASGTQILHSVRVGSSTRDFAQSIEINSAGQVIVQAQSEGQDFPTTAGSWQPEPGLSEFVAGEWDNVVYGLSAQLDALIFATYVGGEGDDLAFAMALDNDKPVLHMDTSSPALRTVSPLQSEPAGFLDRFVPFDSDAASTFSRGDRFVSFGLEVFGVAGPGVNRLYREEPPSGRFGLWLELQEGQYDTRSMIFETLNSDGTPDIITGNYGGPNFLYLSDSNGQFGPPIAFGDPQGLTTAIGISFGTGGRCIVEFIDGSVNRQYRYIGEEGGFDEGEPYGNTATASRDAITVSAPGIDLVEISAPDQVTAYNGCSEDGVVEVVDVLTFEGSDFVDLDFGAFDRPFAVDDVGLADRNGGVVVIRNIRDVAFGSAVRELAGPPTNALLFSNFEGLLTAHDGFYRYAILDADNNFVLDSEVATSTPASDLVVPRFTGEVLSATTTGVEQAAIGSADIYVVRLEADGSDADFATYLGGAGNDFASFGLVTAGPDRILASAVTASQTFPGTQFGLQSSNGGTRDIALFQLNLDIDGKDTDGDGVDDAQDNCTLLSNSSQQDTNGDGFGNRCDPDLNNDGVINAIDLGRLRLAYFGTPGSANWDPDADFNSDDMVNTVDLGILRSFFFEAPGPSATNE